MKNNTLLISFLLLLAFASIVNGQNVPEMMYYKFDVPGATTINSASAPVGTNPSAVTGLTIGGTGQFGAGLVGTGLASSTNNVNTGWVTSLTGSWTISMWVNIPVIPPTTRYFFGDINAGSFRCFTGGVATTTGIRLTGPLTFDMLALPIGVSPFVVHYVYNSTTGILSGYINGVFNSSQSIPGLSITGAGPFYVGGYSGTNGSIEGTMDEFRMYNRALDASEISASWNITLPGGPCTNPPVAGTSTASPSTVCAASASSLNLIGNSFGTGQTYTWQSSTLIGGPYADISGPLSTSSFLINPVSTAYYRCVVTCAQTDTSSPVLVTVNPVLAGGTYTINNTLPTGGGNFNSFTAAINAMSCGISGPVVFNVSAGQVFVEEVPVISVNSTSVNTLKFRKSGAGGNPVIRPSGGAGTTDAGIAISGSDYITFDGIDITINAGSNLEFGYYVFNASATNGASNDSIKNCTITMNRYNTLTKGIYQNVAVTPTSVAGTNSNNTYMNLTIKNAYTGIQLTGLSSATLPDVNNKIITSACNIYNIIGDPSVPMDIGGGTTATQTAGIRVTNQAGFTISNNKVYNVSATTTVDGIFVETFLGLTGSLISTLSNNIVKGIRINSTTATTQVNGIRLTNSTLTPTTGTVLRVYNNSISDITSAYVTATGVAWAATTGIKGLNMASTTAGTAFTYEIYNNSVSIDGSGSPFLTSTAFQRSVTTAGNTQNLIRNNIFANYTGTQTTPAAHYAFVNGLVGTATALGVTGVSFVNNNDLWIANATQGFAARGATTDYATVPTWQTANAQATANQAIDPQVTAVASDLHVNNNALDALGTTYPAYLTQDLDCSNRTGTADMGAYIIAACTSPPTAGTATATPSLFFCAGGALTLDLTGKSTGIGQTYQWQSSLTGGGVGFSNIGALQNASVFTTVASTTLFYRCLVTCSGNTQISSEVQVTVSGAPLAGTYTINSSLPTGGTNFQSFSAAVAALNCGISAAVVFNVISSNGNYNEQIDIAAIPGSTAIKTVTFNGNGATISYDATFSTYYATLNLSGADNLIFNDLNVAGIGAANAFGIHFMNGSDNNIFNNCSSTVSITSTSTNTQALVMNASNTVYSTGGPGGNNNTFNNCVFTGGYYGVVLYGATGAGQGNAGNSFIGCTYRESYSYSTYHLYSTNGIIRNCIMERPTRTSTTTAAGAYLSTGCASMLIEKNRIRNMFGGTSTTTGTFYGIACPVAATSGNENKIYNNIVYSINFNGILYGLYLSGANYCKAYHNSISLDHTGATGTTTTYGIYQTGTTGMDVRNNIVTIKRGGAGVKQCVYYTSTNVNSNKNDLFINAVGGTNYVGNFNGTGYPTLPDWQAANSSVLDQQSVSINPGFTNPFTGLLIPTSGAINDIGDNVGVTTDINGNPRGATPDPGAFEFVPPAIDGMISWVAPVPPVASGLNTISIGIFNNGTSPITSINAAYTDGVTPVSQNFTGLNIATGSTQQLNFTTQYNIISPLTMQAYISQVNGVSDANQNSDTVQQDICLPLAAGTYTINSAVVTGGGNYQTFAEAIARMASCGIAGPVVFDVNATSGPYNEQVDIPSIPGASAVNTITINGNGRTISFNATSSLYFATLNFSGADYFIINNLVIASTGTANAWAVHLMNNSNYNTFNNCSTLVNITSTSTNSMGVVMNASNTTYSSGGSGGNFNTFNNCVFTGGYHSVVCYGAIGLGNVGNSLIGCTLRDNYSYATYHIYSNSVIIRNCIMERPTRTNSTTSAGVYITTGCLNMLVENNRIRNMFGASSTTSGTFYGIYGAIAASPGNENKYYNNAIYSNNFLGTIYGMYFSSGTNLKAYHNTIVFDDTTTALTTASYGIYTTSATNTDIRNNMIFQKRAGSGIKTALYNSTNPTISNNNNIYVDLTTGGTNYYQYNGTTGYTSLAAWQAASGLDLQSKDLNPLFVSPSTGNFTPTVAALNGYGANVGIAYDITGGSRVVSAPDPGAFEFSIPGLDGALAWVSPVIGPAGPNPVTVSVGNLKSTVITSVDITYTDGVTPVSQSFTGLSIPGAGNQPLTFTTPYNLTANTTLKAYITAVNGVTDETQANDTVVQTVCIPLNGTYTINSTLPSSGSNFQNFTALVNALACGGVTGPVTLNVAPGSGPYNEQINIPPVIGTSAVNTVTFNGSGQTLTYDASASAYYGTLNLAGADYLVFNDLNIAATGAANAWGIHFINNSDNNVFNNCTSSVSLTSTSTATQSVIMNASNTTYSTGGSGGNNNTFNNCLFSGGYYGVVLYGASGVGNGNAGNSFIGCKFQDSYAYSTYNLYTTDGIIRNCIIERPNRTSTTTSAGGYFSTGCAGMLVEKNMVRNMFGANPTYTGTCYGFACLISATNGNENVFINNLIYNINFNGTLYGLYFSGGNYIKAYHNTISLDHVASTATGSTYGIYSTGTSGLDFRNNMISITRGGTGTKYCLDYTGTVTLSNNNNLFITPSASNFVGFNGTTTYATLALWQAASLLDAQSVSLDPVYYDASQIDFTPTTPGVWNIGANVGVTTDFNGAPRTVATPDPGAFEADYQPYDLGVKVLVGISTAGCLTATEAVTVTIKNYGLNAVNFSTMPASVTCNVTGATTATLTGNLSGVLNAGATMNFTFPSTLNMTALGTYTFKSFTTMSTDTKASNDSMPVATRTKTAATPGIVTSSLPSICITGSPVLTVSGSSAGSIQWQENSTGISGPWNNVGTGATTYAPGTITQTMYYRSVTSCLSDIANSNVLTVAVGPPDPAPVVTGDSHCAGIMNHLTASGASSLQWYTAQTGGLLMHIGATWDSVWTTTTTYWVESNNGVCPSPRVAVVSQVNPIPPLNPTASSTTICLGDSSQLDAGTVIGGSLTTPLIVGNSSSATGFDLSNISGGPIKIHYLSFTSTAAASTIINESVYYNPTPMNCVFPTDVTTAPGWILIGTVPCTSAGLAPNLTLIPLDLNITIPAGATYAFALGGSSVAYTTGTSGCPVLASDANILVREGFGGTLTGTIANRRWNGSVTYDYGDPNLIFVWNPSASLNNSAIKTPKASPASTTTYTVSATSSFGCSSSSTVVLNVNPVPPQPVVDSVTNVFCGCGSVTLYGHINGSGTTLRWFDAPSGGALLGTGSPFTTAVFCGPKTFYAEEFDAGTGCSSSSRIAYPVTPTAAIAISAGSDAVLCNGAGPATLNVTSANPGYTYAWTPSLGLNTTTGTTVNSNPGVNTSYIVTASDAGSGCITKDTITVFVGVTPIVGTITSIPSSLCFGDTAYLNATATIPGGTVFDFNPPYAPATWTTQHTAGDLGVVNSFTTTSLSMSSSDGATGTTDIDVIHTVTATGSITFNWSYTTVDGPQYDYPMYYKNGVRTMMPGYNTAGTTAQSGSASIPVNLGDVFGFTMESADNGFGPASTTFTNVVFPGGATVLAYSWTPPVGLTNANTSSPKAVAPVGTTTYTVTVSNNGCTADASIPVTVSSTPVPPVVIGDTVCGPDTVHVSATPSSGSNTLYWTDTIGGQIIQTGNTYSHYATNSGSYYVTEAAGSGSSYVGYMGTDLASGFFPDIASYMNFTVINAEGVFINTVQVSTNLGAGTWPLVVALVNTSGQIVSVHDTIYINGGTTLLQTISLNMFVPQGSWRLQPIFNPNLSVHQLGSVTASLPWTIPGLINITCFGNASSTCFSTSPTGTFGLFYNWNVSTVCNSLQSVVNYVVNPSSPIGVATSGGSSFCDVASTAMSAVDSAGSVYETYEWSPATGLSATTGSSVTLTGLTQTTTYTLTAHDVDAGCNAITTKTITIQPKPSLLLSYHDTTICRTESALQLGATAAKSSIVQLGTREDPNFVNGYLYGGNTTQFSQMILTPAELNAAGLFGPTAITSVAYYVSSKLTTTTYTVDIAMRSDGAIPAAFPTTAHILSGLTTVYTNPSVASTLGWNTYNFSTPFNWDGVSNMLVSQCFTHNIPGFFDIVYTSAAGAARYNAINASVCGAAAGALLTDRPNVRFTGGTVFYSWSPAAGLSSTTVEDPVMSPNFAGVDTSIYYVLTVTDPLSGCTAKDSVHINVSSTPLVPLVVFVGDSVLCYSGSPVMRAYGTSGSFQWQVSSNGINFTNIPGENNDTLNAAAITTSTYYRFYSTCGDTSYSRIMFVLVNNPQVVATTGDTICGYGQVCLVTAKNQPNYDVSWYNVPTGGTALAVGDTFCTNISSTTTFYTSVSSPGGPPVTNSYYNYTTTLGSNTFPFGQTAGKEVQWFAGPGEFVTPSPAPAGGMISSISFYASTSTASGTYNQFTLKLGQLSAPFAGGSFYSGPMTTVILPATKTITTTAGAWFTLTFDVPFAYDPTKWLVIDVGHCGITAGSGFNVYQNTLSGVRRVWSVGGCPFAFTSNDATLPGITLGLTTGSQCNSPRVAVTAVSTTAPPLATVSHITTICENSCATLAVDAAGQANYQTFSWSPATGLNSSTGASVQACPTTTTTYTVLGTDLIGGCQRFDTVRVVVNPAPVITISSTPPQICLGDSAQLLATASAGPTGTLAMPPELSTFTGNVRGYSFTAPVSFTITGVQALGTTVGTQSVAIVKFVPAVPPPIFSAVTNSFTTLFLAQNVATGVIPVSITVNAGDVIGVLGCRNTVTSYANPAGPYATTIGGMPVTLTRMGMQFPLTSTAPQDLWTETAGSIGRVELIYGTTGSTTYAWSPPTGLSATNVSNPKASPATATTYTVTVTNNTTGCTKTASIALNITPQPVPYVFPNDTVLCTGQVINIVARDSGAYSGGWPVGTTFDYGFGPTTDSTFLVNGPGNYNVHVTLPPSLGSCNKTSFFANIDYRDAPVLIVTTDSVKCNGSATGMISSQIFLGSPPYRFKYYNSLGSLIRDTIKNETYDTLYNVPAGSYCIVAVDTANTVYPPPSCASDSVCVQIGEPPLLVASESHTIIACNGNSSTVTITATGGTPPLTGTGTFTQFAGTQVYTVTDAYGCTDTVVVVITQPAVLTVTTTVVNIPCNYVAANVNSTVAGGTPSYEYLWSNSAVTPNLSAMGAGTYTITVTDLHGCTATSVATVAPPGVLTVTTTPVMPVCRGAATGTITTSHTGGVGGYTYLWNGGNTNQNRTGLVAGTYTVTVTDINGCTKTKSTVITQPATTLVINSSQTNVRCYGLATGVATVAPAGGSTPYSYSWNTVPVKTTASITGLASGIYTCSVTDAIGCTKTLVVTITQPTDITVFQTQTNVTFPGGNNGSASVSVSGGTPGYTYSWNTVPVTTTATVTGLFAGTYKCTITDTKSCIKKVTFIITEPIAKPGDSPDASLDIRAYPNPTSGVVMLSFSNLIEERFNIRVSDLAGRILFDEEKTAGKGLNEFMYDFTSFSKGVYFINVSAGDRKKVIRIVIE